MHGERININIAVYGNSGIFLGGERGPGSEVVRSPPPNFEFQN